MERTRILIRVLLAIALVSVLAIGTAACSAGDSGTPEPAGTDSGGSTTATDTAGEDPAVALIETKCSMCHSTDRVWAAKKSNEEWVTTVDRMKTNGLVVTDAEYEQIVAYLSAQ